MSELVQPEELEVHLEQDLHGQVYALASPKATPGVPLLYRREPEGYVLTASQDEADAFAELVFLQTSIAQSAGPLLDVQLPDGSTIQLHHEVTVTLEGQEYLVLCEAPLSPQILCVRGPEGTLELVQDPAVTAAVQAHWDQVQASAPKRPGVTDPEGAQLLAEARARTSELRLTLQLFPSTRRGDAEHRELSRLAEELDAQIAALEAQLGG